MRENSITKINYDKLLDTVDTQKVRLKTPHNENN